MKRQRAISEKRGRISVQLQNLDISEVHIEGRAGTPSGLMLTTQQTFHKPSDPPFVLQTMALLNSPTGNVLSNCIIISSGNPMRNKLLETSQVTIDEMMSLYIYFELTHFLKKSHTSCLLLSLLLFMPRQRVFTFTFTCNSLASL